MKAKILALLLAAVMLMATVACDIVENESTDTRAPETSAPETNAPETNAPETDAPETNAPDDSESETNAPDDNDEMKIITIAEALELCGSEGNITTERYYIRGIVKTIKNAEYGQMVVADETGEISVYGTYSADGELRYSELSEKPYKGDEVILHCILQNYNGTKEVKNARLVSFVSNQGNEDVSAYKSATIAEAKAAEEGAKLKVSGVVAKITYANGMKPSGFILVDNTSSIYVYDGDAAARVKEGNKVELAATKTYWILADEQNSAVIFGYKGCNQLDSAILISNDEKTDNKYDVSWITESTVKEIMDNPVSNDITSTIFKVTALVKKVPGNGFVNYYIDDLDGKTGSYVYTQCNGGDFAWLDQFDGKICTVLLIPFNAKSTHSNCFYRFLPVAVFDEGFVFDKANAAEHAVVYYGAEQFKTSYTGNPALEIITSVSSELLGFENATLSYASSNSEIISIDVADGKTVMNCLKSGKATITVTGKYDGKEFSKTVEITVDIPTAEIPSITVGEAISSPVGEVVTVKGIVGPSLVNQTGFYLIDESGAIPVILTEAQLENVQPGHEVILKGTRAIRVKDGSAAFGQTNLDACEIVVNNYGSHEYSTKSFITDKTLKDMYDLNSTEDHGTEIYVLKATVEVVETQHYSTISLVSGSTKFGLYSSSANQYNWLKAYAGQEITVEVAACNWNSKNYYRGCVLAVITEDGKVINTLNFN